MKRLVFAGIIGLLVAVVFMLNFAHVRSLIHKHNAVKISDPAAPPKISIKKVLPAKLSGSYLVSGDVFWGRGIDYFAQQSPLKYDWPFSRLNEFHPEKYNGWISDMECPVTDKSVPYQVQVDSLIFSCSPKYLSSAANWFSALTIANNHTSNTGADGFADTQRNLGAAGIQFFGHYDLGQVNDLCEIVTMKVKVDNQDKKLPIAMCGYHWLSRLPTNDEMAQITKFAQYFPVWVFPHGGTEYSIHSTPAQQALYHKFIDAGADVVFGDHPHVVEETEAYHGKLIAYDMGNLIFDQWFDNEVTKSMIINTRVSATVDANLQKYLDMASNCTQFKDNCLVTAQTEKLKPYKLNYSYDIIAGDSSRASLNERLKHLASPDIQAWLLQRADWKTTLAGLASNP